MSITSFGFLCFYVVLLLLYYILPGRLQGGLILIFSLFFYLTSGIPLLIFYPITAVVICYGGGLWINSAQKEKTKKWILLLVICLNIGALFFLKYINFAINTINGVTEFWGYEQGLLKESNFLIPLGISFYTFSMLGYVIDIYNGIVTPQKSLWKMCIYGMYFPTMISGPILMYRENGQQFFEKHKFDYTNVTFGLQRMLWGFFKKLVISERMGQVVNTVYGDLTAYQGPYIIFATICFAFQLYTDFSGCMDIVLGLSQTLGIVLPENFKTPFFSKTISEYWRRWHITLGVWMKEYVFFPLLRSNFFTKLQKKSRERFGKKKGKQYTTFFAMLILWFTVGIWHGGEWKYVIGSGILHWFYIVIGELLEPYNKKVMVKFNIRENNKVLNAFKILRTFLLVCIGFVFFRATNVITAIQAIKNSFIWNNAGMFFKGGIFTLGLDVIEFTIAAVSLCILLIISILQEKISVRETIATKNIMVRWTIWFALLFYVILLGCYGPGYSASEFIYQGF